MNISKSLHLGQQKIIYQISDIDELLFCKFIHSQHLTELDTDEVYKHLQIVHFAVIMALNSLKST